MKKIILMTIMSLFYPSIAFGYTPKNFEIEKDLIYLNQESFGVSIRIDFNVDIHEYIKNSESCEIFLSLGSYKNTSSPVENQASYNCNSSIRSVSFYTVLDVREIGAQRILFELEIYGGEENTSRSIVYDELCLYFDGHSLVEISYAEAYHALRNRGLEKESNMYINLEEGDVPGESNNQEENR